MLTVIWYRILACLFPPLVSGQERVQASDGIFFKLLLLFQDFFVSDIPGLPMKLLFGFYILMYLYTYRNYFSYHPSSVPLLELKWTLVT